ncbi:MAG: rRNA maturation RNase YbeY [Gammaproteobacteria bacterium]|nr:rRNA maturation RNase YbeY [Gammaproteobacteria bacterium]
MQLDIEVQYVAEDEAPPVVDFEAWVVATVAGRRETAQLAIRIVNEEEQARLNDTYRNQQGATNVLSFPYVGVPGVDLPLLGDLAICAPVVIRQAGEQGKPVRSHWAHMVIHGTLHLLGYDHTREDEAQEMEDLEREILAGLGFSNPY